MLEGWVADQLFKGFRRLRFCFLFLCGLLITRSFVSLMEFVFEFTFWLMWSDKK